VNWFTLIGLFIASGAGGLAIAAALSLPHLVSVTPAPAAQNVSPHARLRLTFDREMDTASLKAALRVQPDIEGAIAWDGATSTLTFTPSRAWPVQSPVTVSLTGGRSALGLPLLETRTWSFTVGQERLLYLTGAPPNLATVSIAEGDTPSPLTAEPFGLNDFALRYDGELIVYSALREDGGADLVTASIDGEARTVVLTCPEAACLWATFSPDGRRIAYERQQLGPSADTSTEFGDPRVHVLTLATGADVIVGDAANPTRSPRWAPDGRLSFYDAGRQAIGVQDLTSGAVTYVPALSGQMGTWSPDTQTLVLPEVVLEEAAPNLPTVAGLYSRLVQVTVATNATQSISGDGVVEDVAPVYSGSGAWLVFARKGLTRETWTPGRQLWLMRADGSEARALTTAGDYHHSAFAWGPEDRWLLFMRSNAIDPGEPVEIWLMNADGAAPRRLVRGGFAPQWVP
jgi:Tol biopolymer transport system component